MIFISISIGLTRTTLNLKQLFNRLSLKRYADFLQSEGYPESTIRRRLSSLSQFQKFLIKKNFLPSDTPVVSLDPISAPEIAPPAALSQPQYFRRYLVISLLAISLLGLGYGLYSQVILRARQQLAYSSASSPTTPNRILSFQGRLTDSAGNPITSSTPILFKLYDTETVGTGTSLYNSSTGNSQTVVPDDNGIFSVVIGKSHGSTIPSSVFTENANVYLEITAGGETMDPRQQIATVGYALNSETLQGLPPSASGFKNTVLVIDDSGNLNLGETSPTIISKSGTLGLIGQALLIGASDTSGGSITLNPDGNGQIKLVTEGTGITTGGLIQATNANLSSGNLFSALINNDNRGYNFIDFSNYNVGTTTSASRFLVTAGGSVTIGGTLSLTNTPLGTGSTILYLNANNQVTKGTFGPYDNYQSWTANVGTSNVSLGSTSTLTFAAGAGLSATLIGNTITFTNTGTGTTYSFTNGLTNNAGIVGLGGTLTQNTQIGTSSFGLSFLGLGGTQSLYIDDSGFVGIGTTSPNYRLTVNGSGNIFSVGDTAGNSLFSITDSAFTSNLPSTFNSSGDVSIAYDLNFTHPSASAIRSSSPLSIVSGDAGASSDLTLQTYNSGNIVLDTAGVTFTGDQYWTLNSGSSAALNVNDLLSIDTSNNRLGIGNSNPAYKLDVTGDARFTSNLTVGGSVTFTGLPVGTGSTIIYIDSTGKLVQGTLPASTVYTAGAGLSMPTASSFSLNLGYTNVWLAPQYFSNGVGITGNLTVGGTFVSVGSTNLVTNLNANYLNGLPSSSFLQTGYTGFINTATNGLSLIGSTAVGLGGTLTQNTQIGASSFKLNFISSNGSQALSIGHSSGYIGIGTTNPATRLEVVGDIRIGTNSQVQFPGSGGLLSSIRTVGTADLTFRINGNDRIFIDSSGNLGVGISSPTYRLHVAGDIGATSLTTTGFINVGTSATIGTNLSVGGSVTLSGLPVGTGSTIIYIDSTGKLVQGTFPPGTTYTASNGITLVANDFRLNLGYTNVWLAPQYFSNGVGITGNLTVGGTFVSVGSTNLVTNLNANYLNGIASSSFLQTGYTGFINTATNGLSLFGSTAVGLGGTLTQNTQIGNSNFNLSFIGLGGSQSLFVSSTGNIGMGTTNASKKLSIYTNTNGDGLWIYGAQTNITPLIGLGDSGYNPLGRIGLAGSNGALSNDSVQYDLVLRSTNKNILFTVNDGASSAMKISSSGQIGIGTTSPAYRLHVAGDIGATSLTTTGFINVGTSATIGTNLSVGGSVTFTGLPIGTGSTVLYISTNGSLVQGTLPTAASTSYTFLNGLASIGGGNTIGLGGSLTQNTQIGTSSFNLILGNNTTSPSLYVASTGFIGIGTSSPGTALDVTAGRIRSTSNNGTPTSGSGIEIFSDGTTSDVLSYDRTGASYKDLRLRGANVIIGDGTNLLYFKNGGNVGINTTNPGYRLHVAGDIGATSLTTTGFINVGTSATIGTNLSVGGSITAASLPLNTGTSIAYISSTGVFSRGLLNATNGLTFSSGNITLGGTLTQNTQIGTSSFGLSFLGLGNTIGLSIGSSGNVGIGTSNITAGAKLDIRGDTYGYYFYPGNGAIQTTRYFGDDGTYLTASNLKMNGTFDMANQTMIRVFEIDAFSDVIGIGNSTTNEDKFRFSTINGSLWIGGTSANGTAIQELDVEGDINLTGTVYANGFTGASGQVLASTGVGLTWITPGGASYTFLNGLTSIGGGNTIGIGGSLTQNTTIGTSSFTFSLGHGNTQPLFISAGGLVSIGATATASYRLHVFGDIGSTSLTTTGFINVGTSATIGTNLSVGGSITAASLPVGTGTSIAYISSTGIVSRGLLNAANGLTFSSGNITLGGTLTQNTQIGTSSYSIAFLGLGNTIALAIGRSGYVGIGTSNPVEPLDVNIGNTNALTVNTAGDVILGAQFQLGSYSAPPTAVGAGAMYFNTSTNTNQCYNGSSWYNCGGTLYSNSNVSVADGSYITVAHSLNTNDLISTAWINSQSTWKALDATYRPAIAWEGKDTQRGVYHNEVNLYLPTTETNQYTQNLLQNGLFFDTFEDLTKTDATSTISLETQKADNGTANLMTLQSRQQTGRAGLWGNQILTTGTSDTDNHTFLGNNTVTDTEYYDRTRDSDPLVLVELGIDPNWYNGVTLTTGTTTSTGNFSPNSTIPKNPSLSTSYNGALLKVSGTYGVGSSARTIYVTMKGQNTFDWTDNNGNSQTGTTFVAGVGRTLSGNASAVTLTFTNTNYNVGDVFRIASWYVEPSGTTRGSKQQFPERSHVIATAGSIDILDADTQKLWMRLSTGTNYLMGSAAPSTVNVLNGKVYKGSGNNGTGIYYADFVFDTGYHIGTGGLDRFTGSISQRNTGLSLVWLSASPSVVTAYVNDIDSAVVPNQPTQEVTVSGWGFIQGNNTTSGTETVSLPYKFNQIPAITTAYGGATGTSAPSSLADCTLDPGTGADLAGAHWNDATASNFNLVMTKNTGTFSSSYYYCYTWSANGVVSPKQFVAAAIGATATDGGTSIINETDVSSVNIEIGSTWSSIWWQNKVVLLSNGDLYLGNHDGTNNWNSIEKYTGIHGIVRNEGPIAEFRAGYYLGNWSSGNELGVFKDLASTTNTIRSLHVTQGTSTYYPGSNTIYIGTDEGVSVIHEGQPCGTVNTLSCDGLMSAKGSVKFYTKDYVSEEMVGNIRGMWPLSFNGAIGLTSVTYVGGGSSLTLTNTNSVTAASGVRGVGASFNGSTQYLSCTDANCGGTNNLDPGTMDWSIGAWIKTSSSSRQSIIRKGSGVSGGTYLLEVGTGTLSYYFSDQTNTISANGTRAVNDGLWHHVVLTVSRTVGAKLYVDGQLDGSTALATPNSINNGDPFYIGVADGGLYYFNGLIDEPFATASEIPARQIKHMYETGFRALQSHGTNLGGASATTNQQLAGTAANVGDVKPDWNNQYMYVGTNNTSTGALSVIQLNSDSLVKKITASTNNPTGGAILNDEDINGLSVSYDLEVVGSGNSGAHIMGADNNATATSGSYYSDTLTLPKNIGSAVLWVSPSLDSSDTGSTMAVKASVDGGSNYATCTLVNTNSNPALPEREYACTFATSGSSLKVRFDLSRSSTRSTSYITQFGISWLGETGFRIEQADTNNVRLYNYSGEAQNLRLNVTGASTAALANPWTDGGSYLYATGYETLRTYDGTGTNFLELSAGTSAAYLGIGGSKTLTISNSGYVGIGNTSPLRALHVAGPLDTDNNVTAQFDVGNTGGLGYGASIILRNLSGSTNSVTGVMGVNSSSVAIAGIEFVNVNNGPAGTRQGALSLFTIGTGDTVNRIYYNQSGYLGIGTTNPAVQLDVNGKARLSTTETLDLFSMGSNYRYGMGVSAAYLNIYTHDSSSGMQLGRYNGSSFTPQVTLNSSGNLGIGTTNPGTHRLAVVGTAGLSTGTLWTNTSDRRIKQNISVIGDGLSVINSLIPSQYNYTPEYLAAHPELNNILYYGFVAQDYEKVFPNSVSMGGDGYLQVNQTNVIPYTVKAIQELNVKIDSLEFTTTGEVALTSNINPSVLSSLGYADSKNEIESASYTISDTLGTPITRIGQFASLTAAKIKSGLVSTTNLIAENIVAETTKSRKIQTATISPLSDITDTVVVDGQLAAVGLQTTSITTEKLEAAEATISTLYADNIVSKNGSFGNLMTAKISALREEIRSTIVALNTEPTLPVLPAIASASAGWTFDIATSQAQITGSLALTDNLVIGGQLAVIGRADFSEAVISGRFQAGQISLKDNLIETTASALYVQPSGTGAVNILNGRLVVADSGEITVNGNLAVTGSITSDSLFGRLITATEISAQKVTTEKLVIASPVIASASAALEASSSAVASSNSTAGTVILPAGTTEVTINNPQISDKSIIYLTPAGSTNNQVVYLKSKSVQIDSHIDPTATPTPSTFTIAIDQPLSVDININWWIIN